MNRAGLVIAVLICLSGCHQPLREQTLVYEALFDRIRVLDPPYNVLAEPVDPRGPGAGIAELAEYHFPSADFIHEADNFGAHDVRLIREAEYAEIFSSDARCGRGWEAFVDQYGDGGLVRLSGVGFSEDASRAVVYIELASECSRAGGFLMRFDKNESWLLTETERIWL